MKDHDVADAATGLPLGPLPPIARTGNTAFATSVALLVLRLMLGWIFFYHAAQNAWGWFDGPGIGGFADVLATQHLPAFLPATAWAYIAAYGELVGGLSVFFGLLARLGAIPLIIMMLTEIAKHSGVHGFSAQNGGDEYNLLIIAVAVAIIICGPGLISCDAFLFRRGFWARGAQPLGNPHRRPDA